MYGITKRGREQGSDFRAVAFVLRSHWNRMLLPLGLPAGLTHAWDDLDLVLGCGMHILSHAFVPDIVEPFPGLLSPCLRT